MVKNIMIVGNDYIAIDDLDEHAYNKLEKTHKNEMQDVFINGVYFNRQNLMDIRARLAKEVE